MFVSRSELQKAIKEQIKQVSEYLLNHPAIICDSVPCVVSQQVSPRKFSVGWRFTKIGTVAGDVQEDCHASYSKYQVIEWVYSDDTTATVETPPRFNREDAAYWIDRLHEIDPKIAVQFVEVE